MLARLLGFMLGNRGGIVPIFYPRNHVQFALVCIISSWPPSGSGNWPRKCLDFGIVLDVPPRPLYKSWATVYAFGTLRIGSVPIN